MELINILFRLVIMCVVNASHLSHTRSDAETPVYTVSVKEALIQNESRFSDVKHITTASKSGQGVTTEGINQSSAFTSIREAITSPLPKTSVGNSKFLNRNHEINHAKKISSEVGENTETGKSMTIHHAVIGHHAASTVGNNIHYSNNDASSLAESSTNAAGINVHNSTDDSSLADSYEYSDFNDTLTNTPKAKTVDTIQNTSNDSNTITVINKNGTENSEIMQAGAIDLIGHSLDNTLNNNNINYNNLSASHKNTNNIHHSIHESVPEVLRDVLPTVVNHDVNVQAVSNIEINKNLSHIAHRSVNWNMNANIVRPANENHMESIQVLSNNPDVYDAQKNVNRIRNVDDVSQSNEAHVEIDIYSPNKLTVDDFNSFDGSTHTNNGNPSELTSVMSDQLPYDFLQDKLEPKIFDDSAVNATRDPDDVDPLKIFVEDITYQRFPKPMSLLELRTKVLGKRYKKLYILEESKKKLFQNIRQVQSIYTIEDDTLYVTLLYRFIFSRACQEIKRFRLGKLVGNTDMALFVKEIKDGLRERILFFSERPDDYVFFMSCTDMNSSPYACRDNYYVTLDSARDPPNNFPWEDAARELRSKMRLTFEDPRFIFNFVLMPCARAD